MTLITFAIALTNCTNKIDTVDELITAHIEAIGGYEAIKELHTLTFIGTYEEATFKQIHRFDKKRPYLIRITTNYNEETGTYGYCEGFDGAAWEYSSKIPIRVIGEPSRALNNASRFEKSYIDYEKKGHKAEFKGIKTVKGIDVYHLEIITEGGKVENFLFDVSTLMESVSIGKAPFHGEGAEIEIFEKRSGYRPVNGVLMPFKIESFSGETRLSLMQWDKIEANKEIPDEWFSPPLSEKQKMFKTYREKILDGNMDEMHSGYLEYHNFSKNQLNNELAVQINTFGYELISYERYKDAIALFELAVAEFPRSSNLYDSLGETYLKIGDTLNAVINYRRSVVLNPNNTHGIEVLSQISN